MTHAEVGPFVAFPLCEIDGAAHGHVTAAASEGDAVVLGTSTGHLLRLSAPADLSIASAPAAALELVPKQRVAVKYASASNCRSLAHDP